MAPDMYCAAVWREMARLVKGLPDIERGGGISVVVTRKMKRVLAGLHYEDMVPGLAAKRAAIAARSLEKSPGLWAVMIRPGLLPDYRDQVIPASGDAWVWSLWRGYLEEERLTGQLRELRAFLAPCGEPIRLHTSGHASPALLRGFARAMNPKTLVPVHGEAWREHQAGFPNLHILADGQWLDLS